MKFFDFHHHNPETTVGIYNLKFGETISEHFFSAGIHPDSISEDIDEHFAWLNEVSLNKNCIAIGECGLDGLINIDENLQEEVFERQISLANKIKKPLIIHCVKRFSQLMLFKKKSKVPMIVHGFNKRKIIGDDLLKHDFYLSFGKAVLYNLSLQNIVKNIPLDKIFLETDNEYFNIEELYRKVSEIKNITIEDLHCCILENLEMIRKI
jgi:TatD DNase family protein